MRAAETHGHRRRRTARMGGGPSRTTTAPNGPRTPVFKCRRREIRVGVEWKTHVAEVLQTLAREARRFDDVIGCRGFQCVILGRLLSAVLNTGQSFSRGGTVARLSAIAMVSPEAYSLLLTTSLVLGPTLVPFRDAGQHHCRGRPEPPHGRVQPVFASPRHRRAPGSCHQHSYGKRSWRPSGGD